MKYVRETQIKKQEELKFPCLLELINSSNERTGVVILMVVENKGLVVSVSQGGISCAHYQLGYWCDSWSLATDPIAGRHWAPFTGTITLEND